MEEWGEEHVWESVSGWKEILKNPLKESNPYSRLKKMKEKKLPWFQVVKWHGKFSYCHYLIIKKSFSSRGCSGFVVSWMVVLFRLENYMQLSLKMHFPFTRLLFRQTRRKRNHDECDYIQQTIARFLSFFAVHLLLLLSGLRGAPSLCRCKATATWGPMSSGPLPKRVSLLTLV